MLKLENVSKFYYNKGVIASGFTKINLELKIGEFVTIIGESGSGKSTLLNVISGLDSYEEGEMYINGKETSHYTEKECEDYRRKYIANIFQSFNLINSYTVYQNVELVLLLNGYKKHNVKKRILDIIEQVGLTKFKNTKVSKLSGGQKQRVAIARAMVKETPIIVADEPTGNLDSKSASEVIEILKKVAKDKLVIVVTHNIEQIEKYATRIIKMHDGKIIENNEIKKITKEPPIRESEYNNLKIGNKYRLGLRNTFNIIPKFLLLFAVFFFMSSAVLLEYSSFQMSEKNTISNYDFSRGFKDLSENRIIINKKDRKAFTDDEYEKIKTLSNIDYIAKDDVLLDGETSIRRKTEKATNNIFPDITFSGSIIEIENFRGNLNYGRMPKNDNEIIIKAAKKQYCISERLDDTLNHTFSITKANEVDSEDWNSSLAEVTIVGIQVCEDDNIDYRSNKIYVSQNILNKLRNNMNKVYSEMKVLLNNKIYDQSRYNVEPNENVPKGKAIVDDELKYQYKNYKTLNQPIKLYVKNIYYEQELEVEIVKTYTKYNFRSLTGLTNYDFHRNMILVNPDDYNELFNKPSYQSSVYVKDVGIIDITMQELSNLGLNPKRVIDFKITRDGMEKKIIKIMKVIVTAILIIVLFFTSYIIIKIILKSRNVYHTTLRMLGATYKNVRRLLSIELFINSTLSYIILMLILVAVKKDIIRIEFIKNLCSYLTIKEYVLMYIVLILMSKLISMKFSRKVFKKSAISTYSEGV